MHGEFLIWIFNASVDGRNPNLENASVSPAKGPMMSHHLHFKWLISSEADSSRKKKIFRFIIFKYFSAGCVKSKCVFIINMLRWYILKNASEYDACLMQKYKTPL